MKVRTGFVSNSSSSSFVLIGNEINFSDVDKYESVWFVGDGDCGDGIECFEIDDEFRRLYKGKQFKDCEFYSVVKTIGDWEETLTPEDISKIRAGMTIKVFECSYYDRYNNKSYREELGEDYIDEN